MIKSAAKKYGLMLVLLTWVSTPVHARDWIKDGWEFVSEGNGIKVFRKNYPSSAIRGVAGETLLDAPVGKVLWIMVDHPHKQEWINRFKEAHTIEDIPPSSNLQYSAFHLPFPISDRDFVFRNDFTVDRVQKAVVIDVKSVEDPRQPIKKGNIRGEIVRGRYTLIPYGAKTMIQAEYLADPKGAIPAWLINVFQKEWPYKTLDAMRQQLKKPYVQEWEVYTKVLKDQLESAP